MEYHRLVARHDDFAPADLSRIGAFGCGVSDDLWTVIEKALDNGYGLVFVIDRSGRVLGRVTLDDLRAVIRTGAHLNCPNIASLVKPLSEAAEAVVSPVLDGSGRLVDVRIRPEAELVPVSVPDLSSAEFRNVLDAFLSTWISSTGQYLREFEVAFAGRSGMSHGVAVSNGTVSLQLAMAALRIGPGDEVIVPDLTFAATANAVIHAGAVPVLVDIDPQTWCISLEAIERAITPRTQAIIPVHLFGRPAPMTEIEALARKHGLRIIEDCAEAHGASYDGRPIGSFSDVASYSFFANKILTTGEGGICLTNDREIAARLQMLRDHGMRLDRRYWHEEPGFNFRMTNIQAAIGCAQLGRMDAFLDMRQRVHDEFERAFAGLDAVSFPPPLSERFGCVTWFSCALVPAGARADLIAACRAANIDIRPFVNSLSAMPAYTVYAAHCPVSADLSPRGIHLPTHNKVDRHMCENIRRIFDRVLS